MLRTMAREVLGVRLDPKVKAALTLLANAEDRTPSRMAAKLIAEALIARGVSLDESSPESGEDPAES
jgi:predicted transcriptional regulator